MTSRHEVSAARREKLHQARVNAAETPTKRFWAHVAWLLVEAKRAGQLEDVATELRRLIDRIRQGQPLRDTAAEPAPAPAAQPALTAAPAADETAPWYELARRDHTPQHDRTEPAA